MARENDLPQVDGITPEDPAELTLVEICRVCAVQSEFIVELVEQGALAPAGEKPEGWRFTYTHVRRVQVASHLQRDLGVNPAGAALALELMEQIEALRAKLEGSGRG